MSLIFQHMITLVFFFLLIKKVLIILEYICHKTYHLKSQRYSLVVPGMRLKILSLASGHMSDGILAVLVCPWHTTTKYDYVPIRNHSSNKGKGIFKSQLNHFSVDYSVALSAFVLLYHH